MKCFEAFSGSNESRPVNEFSLWASKSPVIVREQVEEHGSFYKKDKTGKEEKIEGKKGNPILQPLNKH